MDHGIWVEGGVVRWLKGLRLERLSSGYTEYFPQAEPFFISPSTLGHRPLVIVGEEGSGESTFLLSLEEAAKAPPTSTYDLEDFEGTSQSDLNAYLKVGLFQLHDWVQKHREPGRLVIKGMDRMNHPNLATKLLSKLRRFYDGNVFPGHASVMVFARDERAVEIEPYSAIVSVSDFCRLARWQVDELVGLLADRSGLDKGDVREKAIELSRLAGGQPLLTRLILDKLGEVSAGDLRQAMTGVRDYPPAVLVAWRQRLARIIERDREIRSFVGDLIKGQEYEIGGTDPAKQAPYATRALSLSGWMAPSVTADGARRVWRFSELHRFWAAPVLREPRRFLPVGGDR